MSKYSATLDCISKQRYINKLALVDMKIEDDPFEEKNQKEFEDDMKKWPQVEFGHIFCYYIERPGLYTRRQLLQWKSLDAFNYFQSGHVRTVRIKKMSQCCIMMAYVNPSQSSPDKAHLTSYYQRFCVTQKKKHIPMRFFVFAVEENSEK